MEITLPTGSRPRVDLAAKVLALIADEEGKYQTSLNDTYQEMGEKTFKALRRALPLTRQKIDWDKVDSPSFASVVLVDDFDRYLGTSLVPS